MRGDAGDVTCTGGEWGKQRNMDACLIDPLHYTNTA